MWLLRVVVKGLWTETILMSLYLRSQDIQKLETKNTELGQQHCQEKDILK